MSENTPPEGGNQNPGNPGGEGNTSNPNDVEFVPKSEFEKVERANAWAQSQYKTIKGKFDSLQAELESLKADKGDGDKGKSSERIAAAEAKIQELQNELTARDAKIRDFTVKGKVLDAARGVIREDALEAFWQLEGSKFDVVEFNGEQHVGLKDQPYTKLTEYFQDDVKQRLGFLVANPRSSGTGEPNKGAAKGDSSGVSMKHLETLSPRERTAIFNKDPKIREEWVKHRGFVP